MSPGKPLWPPAQTVVIPGPTGIFLAALTSTVMVAFALAHEGKSLRVPAPTSDVSLALAVLAVNAVPVHASQRVLSGSRICSRDRAPPELEGVS